MSLKFFGFEPNSFIDILFLAHSYSFDQLTLITSKLLFIAENSSSLTSITIDLMWEL